MLLLPWLEWEEELVEFPLYYGGPPLLPVALPLASPSSIMIAMAIWAKKVEAEHDAFSTTKMRNYHHVIQGNNLHPWALVFRASTQVPEPKCFLT